MMQRIPVLIVLAAAVCLAAPKERAWQDGKIQDTRDNKYFSARDLPGGATRQVTVTSNAQFDVYQNDGNSTTAYDHFVIEGVNSVYLTEFGRLRSFPAPRLTVRKPVKFAVEKNKLWVVDEGGKEFEFRVLKEVPREGAAPLVTQVHAPAPTPAASSAVAAVPVPVKQAPVAANPPAAATPPVAVAKTAPKQETLVAKAELPSPAPVPAAAPAPADSGTHSASKDRPWQSGQLLSTPANPYFGNLPFSSESDVTSWVFAQGKDGKYTASGRPAALGSSPYLYDNYVIETEFCAYLAQRSRLKTVPPAHFIGTKPVKFAVEKSKLWITDEDGKEYETKIVKQLQKEPAGPESLSRTASR